MPPKPTPKTRGDYIETDTGNKVARKSQLYGTQHIILGGRTVVQPHVCIRGDLVRSAPPSNQTATTGTSTTDATTTPANGATAGTKPPPPSPSTTITIGRYTHLSHSTLLRPPSRLHRSTLSHHPLKISDNVLIHPSCIIEAALIGEHVVIGAGSVVGKMVVIRDWVRVLEGSVVPAGMVVPSGVVVGGRPARVVGEVGEGWGVGGGEGGGLRGLWRGVG
ncbi:hypothetical protein MMC21_000017 [Puttea exsequens]|nr:hypothetical protein [Puttea exsequens]